MILNVIKYDRRDNEKKMHTDELNKLELKLSVFLPG